MQGVEHAHRDRVHRRGVERHRGDAARHLGEHQLVSHSVVLLRLGIVGACRRLPHRGQSGLPWPASSARARAIASLGRRVAPRKRRGLARRVDDQLGRRALPVGRIEHGAHGVADQVHVGVGLHARGHGPEHVEILGHVDVVVDHHHQLEGEIVAERSGRDVPRLARRRVAHRDVGMEPAGARLGIGDRRHVGMVLAQGAHQPRLLRNRQQQRVLVGDAGHDVLEDGVLAMEDRVDLEDMLGRALRRIARELGERALPGARSPGAMVPSSAISHSTGISTLPTGPSATFSGSPRKPPATSYSSVSIGSFPEARAEAHAADGSR